MIKAVADKIKKYPLLGFTLAVMILCAPLFCMEYATDTYAISSMGMRAFADLMYHNGRLFAAAFFALFGKLSLGIEAFYYTSFLLSLLFASLSCWRLYRLLKPHTPPAVALFLSFFTILNPIAVEYFLFIEKGFFLFGIFMSIVALENYVKALRGDARCILWSLLALTASAFVYQPLPGVFASFSVAFTILYAKNFKSFLGKLLLAVGIYGSCGLCNLLFTKFIGQSARTGNGAQLSNLLHGLFAYGTLLSSLLYLGILLLLAVICLAVIKRRHGRVRGKPFAVLFWECCFCFLAALTVTIVPFVFVPQNEIWLPFRILYPMSMCLGSIPLLFFYRSEARPERTTQSETKPLRLVLALILLLNYSFFQVMTVGRLINNAADERLCQTIGEQIAVYEQQTGNQITQIAIYHDEQITHSNPGVLAIGDSNIRAFSKAWSDVDHMCLILDRPFVKVKSDHKIYQQYFAGHDWNGYHEDQVVFVENTLHLCVY